MRISSENTIFTMDRFNKPALTVASGETVTFETLDCFSNTVLTESDLVSSIDFSQVNPATGPLFIQGAEVGDVLKVTIKKISLADKGAIVTAPGLGRLAKRIEAEETVICPVTDTHVEYKGIHIPLRKMIGVIGTAPANEGINTGTPHDHGGNLDTTRMTEGSILYLPVNVEGALLAMGDLHATMGDGEIMGAGLEIAGEVTVKVEVLRDFNLPLPLIETDELWVTLGSRETLEEASQVAIDHMTNLIIEVSDLTLNQAGMLLSLAGDLHTSQIVNPNVTVRMELPKILLNKR